MRGGSDAKPAWPNQGHRFKALLPSVVIAAKIVRQILICVDEYCVDSFNCLLVAQRWQPQLHVDGIFNFLHATNNAHSIFLALHFDTLLTILKWSPLDNHNMGGFSGIWGGEY